VKINRRIIKNSAGNDALTDMISAMRSLATCAKLVALFSLATISSAQGIEDVTARGEKVFQETCATGYCHGAKGTVGGAPRLVGRGFDQAFITATITRGVPGTAMRAFGTSLERRDLTAVIAYVASLNGIAAPGANASRERPVAALSAEAARGRDLFFDATRSFARCSTCHEVGGMGIPVATPIASIPADVQALRSLATPGVRTAVIDGDSMSVLVVSEGKRRTIGLRPDIGAAGAANGGSGAGQAFRRQWLEALVADGLLQRRGTFGNSRVPEDSELAIFKPGCRTPLAFRRGSSPLHQLDPGLR
jgi:mono/diheme cytochrome c family protein